MTQQSITSGLKFIAINVFLISVTFNSLAQAHDERAAAEVGTQFPSQILLENKDATIALIRTGSTIRRKFFLKIYAMAHYLEQQAVISGEETYQDILENGVTKQISMVFQRSLTAEQIQKSLISGIKLNTDEEEYQQILPDVEVFTQAINADVKKNDEFIIRWYSDGTMVSIFEGKQISVIRNNRFARSVWSIWFGDDSVVDRKSLIKEL